MRSDLLIGLLRQYTVETLQLDDTSYLFFCNSPFFIWIFLCFVTINKTLNYKKSFFGKRTVYWFNPIQDGGCGVGGGLSKSPFLYYFFPSNFWKLGICQSNILFGGVLITYLLFGNQGKNYQKIYEWYWFSPFNNEIYSGLINTKTRV